METWKGKVAVVTGASSGIGRAIAVTLLRHGVHVAGLSRRVDKMKEIENESSSLGNFLPVACDVTNPADVQHAFQTVQKALGAPTILINNAGVAKMNELKSTIMEEARLVLETNVLAVISVTKEALSLMDPQGIIININSTAGHVQESLVMGGGVYTASKKASVSLTQTLQRELSVRGSTVRVTSISPGLTRTEMSGSERGIFDGVPILEAEDVAECVIFVLSLPKRVNVLEIILDPSGFCRPKFAANNLVRAGLM